MSRSTGLFIIFGVLFLLIHSCSSENHICGFSGDSVICCEGYGIDKEGECSIPICTNSCGRNGKCIEPDMCRCSDGKTASTCYDEESNDGNSPQIRGSDCPDKCNGLGTCIYGRCQCKRGYIGETCSEQEEGECYLEITRGVCKKRKQSLYLKMDICCGAFNVAWGDPCQRCEKRRCEKGFVEIDGICKDIDECTIPSICETGKCENLHGSYRCICPSSYQFDPTQADCIPMKKKCEREPNLCGSGMECISLSIYQHTCKCLPGYVKSLDGQSCVQASKIKVNMCLSYGPYICHFGKCVPNGYSYRCECNPGYMASSDGKSCKKAVDYCRRYSNVVCQNGKCVSLSNDYICQCDPGYTPSYDRKKCTSICDLYPTALCENGQCIPQANGNYECRCNAGYSSIGKGKKCRRIMNDQSVVNPISSNDEQAASPYDTDFCSHKFYRDQCKGGRCTNMKNNYQCECLEGFTIEKNGQSCKKIEVYRNSHMNDAASTNNLKSYCENFGNFLCSKGRCVESGSSYQCICDAGYEQSRDGKSCFDVNECSSNPNICEQGTCTNSPGSYQCSCFDGFTIHYEPGGPKCYDRNECEEDKALCLNGICINTWGSFKCSCNTGFIASNRKQQCIAVQQNSDMELEENTKICQKCTLACTSADGNKWLCSCPNELSGVLNFGLCAQMEQVVDVQFNTIARNSEQKQNQTSQSYLHFELIDKADPENFRLQVTTQFRDVSLDKCEVVKREGEKTGVRCFYHKT